MDLSLQTLQKRRFLDTSTPQRAHLNVTGRCNSRCRYCLCWRTQNAVSDPSTEELKSVIAQIAELGVTQISFSGGEPLLRSDLETLVEYAVVKGLSIWLVTNGLMLTTHRFMSLAKAGLGGLGVSLDSLDSETYRYLRGVRIEKILKNLINAAKGQILPVAIATTICSINLHELKDLVSFAKTHRILISFQLYQNDAHLAASDSALSPTAEEIEPVINELCEMKKTRYPIANSREYLQSLPEYLRRGEWTNLPVCLAPLLEICIGETLNILPCWGKDMIVGNLRKTSLREIWYSPRFQEIRETLRNCRNCALSCHLENSQRNLLD